MMQTAAGLPAAPRESAEVGNLMKIMVIAAALLITAGIGFKLAEKAARDTFLASAARFRAAAGAQADAPVSEDDLRELPEPMARYMRFSGALGKKRITAVHLVHSGQFKPAPTKPWMPILGEYFITTKKPSFAWYGKVRAAPGIPVVAFDSYFEGNGHMLV